MHIIFSSEIAGAGLAEGFPAFYLWNGAVIAEDTVTAVSIPAIEELLGEEKIDDPANLADAPVWLVAGAQDWVVPADLAA